MTFQPLPEQELRLENTTYHIAEHPSAPGMPYGQEGRRAVVYQLIAEDAGKHALKAFKSRFRVPRMVAVSEKLKPYASLPGLQACKRVVLTASHHRQLLSKYPDLAYAVLMPWIEGETWQEILLADEGILPERSLQLAHNFADLLVCLEEQGLAHCDLSGPNLIVQPGEKIGLVDLEEMYGPDFLKPKELPAGSPGYAHQSAPRGLWTEEADRFAGAVLLAEMLTWCDFTVQKHAWGESYFAPKDMQGENERYSVLHTALENIYGKRVAALFVQAWRSGSLRDCPTFAEWAVALPEEIKTRKPSTEPHLQEPVLEREDALAYFLQAQKATEKGDITQALFLYRKAIAVASPDLSGEIEKCIAELENLKQEKQASAKPPKLEQKYPARECANCGKRIPAGQAMCPYCEGVLPRVRKEETHTQPWWQHWGVWVGILGAIALVFALAIALVFALAIGNNSPEPAAIVEAVVVEKEDSAGNEIQAPATDRPSPTDAPLPSDTPPPNNTSASALAPTIDISSPNISPIDGMPMVNVPAGEFIMGSDSDAGLAACQKFYEPFSGSECRRVWSEHEGPVHTVMLDAYWIDQYEVTNAQYQKCVAAGYCNPPERTNSNTHGEYYGNSQYDGYPVIEVNWQDAQTYCEWAGRRLPTEEEWEKAARGTTGWEFPWGDDFYGVRLNFCDSNCGVSWANTNYDDGYADIAPVGSYLGGASIYGAFDMAGNVQEWVENWYEGDYNGVFNDPMSPASGTCRVLRGGSWSRNGTSVRTTSRDWAPPDYTSDDIGFRCASSP